MNPRNKGGGNRSCLLKGAGYMGVRQPDAWVQSSFPLHPKKKKGGKIRNWSTDQPGAGLTGAVHSGTGPAEQSDTCPRRCVALSCGLSHSASAPGLIRICPYCYLSSSHGFSLLLDCFPSLFLKNSLSVCPRRV